MLYWRCNTSWAIQFTGLNVKLLLFMDPKVNIVEVLTIRTLFSP